MGISYTKRKSGRWQARVRVKGKPSKSKTTDTKKEAQEWALKALQEMQSENGENPYIMDYLRSYAEERKAMLTRLNSKAGWDHMTHIASLFFEKDRPRKGERLRDVDRKRYKEFILFLGRNFAQSSNRRVHQSLKAAFDDALANHLIDDNPAAHIATRDIGGVSSAERKVDRPIGREDTKRIIRYITLNRLPWAHIKDHPEQYFEPGYNLMILTALMTGAREGELAGLRAKDIKIARNAQTGERDIFFSITHQIDTAGGYPVTSFVEDAKKYDAGASFSELKIIRPLKTKESKRLIRIPGILYTTLSRAFVRNIPIDPETPIFKTRSYKTMNRASLSLYVHRLLGELGIESKNYHFHSLRGTHVAILLDRGVPLEAISKRLGHATVQMTLKRYAYTLKEKQVSDEEAIAENLNQIAIEPISSNGDDDNDISVINTHQDGISNATPAEINHKNQVDEARKKGKHNSDPWIFDDFVK